MAEDLPKFPDPELLPVRQRLAWMLAIWMLSVGMMVLVTLAIRSLVV